MSDQQWAIIIGVAVMATVRIVDFFFPKGKWFNWHGHAESEEDKDE